MNVADRLDRESVSRASVRDPSRARGTAAAERKHMQVRRYAVVALFLSSAAHAEEMVHSPGVAEEPTHMVAANGLGISGEFAGFGALLEAQHQLGTGRFWARASVGGGRLTNPTSGGGGSLGDMGDGTFARGALGIEARASTGELHVFADLDVGYQYLGFDYAPAVRDAESMAFSSHAPMAALRGGLGLGGPRLQLRLAVEYAGYLDLDRDRVQRSLSAALGLAVGL